MRQIALYNHICDFDQQMLQADYCLSANENERRAIMRDRRALRVERISEICMRSLRSPLRLHREKIKLTDRHDDFF